MGGVGGREVGGRGEGAEFLISLVWDNDLYKLQNISVL